MLFLQGLFVPFARVGSSDPVRVFRLFHNKYSGYCCIHLLCKAMYNLSLPKLSANYYGLPTTVQLWAACEPMFTVRCLTVNCSGTVLYLPGTVSFWDRSFFQVVVYESLKKYPIIAKIVHIPYTILIDSNKK